MVWQPPSKNELKLRRYYAAQALKDRRPVGRPFVEASSLGKCIRLIMLKMRADERLPTPWQGYMPMYLGTKLHDVFRPDMIEAGIPITDQEILLKKDYKFTFKGKSHRPYPITVSVVGHQDGKILEPVGSVLQELKTMSHYRYQSFERIRESNDMLWMEDKFYGEMIQTNVYMDMGKHVAADIWVFNRSNGQFFSKRIVPSPEKLIARLTLVASAIAVFQASNKKVIPDKPFKPGNILCKICDYKKLCHGDAAESLYS